jgi:hypothetical protein
MNLRQFYRGLIHYLRVLPNRNQCAMMAHIRVCKTTTYHSKLPAWASTKTLCTSYPWPNSRAIHWTDPSHVRWHSCVEPNHMITWISVSFLSKGGISLSNHHSHVLCMVKLPGVSAHSVADGHSHRSANIVICSIPSVQGMKVWLLYTFAAETWSSCWYRGVYF